MNDKTITCVNTRILSQPLQRQAPLALALVLALAPPAAHAARRPPTVDPSYGLPLPAKHKVIQPAAWWIWARTVSDNQKVLFRRSFVLPRAPALATLYITADDFFTL